MRLLFISLLAMTLFSLSFSTPVKHHSEWVPGNDYHTLRKFNQMYSDLGEIRVTPMPIKTTTARAQRNKFG